MPLDLLDVIVRVAGATLLLVAAATARGRMAGARGWFIPLAVCLCGFLAGNTPNPGLQLGGPLGSVAVILAGYAAAFLWWFCLAVFDASFRPRGAVLAAGAAWIVIASADRGLFGPALEEAGLSWALVALGLGMCAHLAWRLLRDREGDLVDARRRVRHAVVLVLGGQLLADLLIDLVLGMDWQPQAFSIAQNAGLLAFTIWLLSLTPRTAAADAPATVAAAADPALARLRTLIEGERLHLDPDLTFADFVRAMGAPEKAVRRLINRELGHDHFRTFLNTHRVAEARRLLADPARRDDKLIAVAFDAGFASLPSFNRAFREIDGRTPSAYRAAALAGQAAAPRTADAVF
ncbi:helix-turn-helix domain-containing protein [Phenylobacterium sp. J367]|uniref:AraC family transcriptional regulator n=1 Tax=Phenylobacterium sp. J367 TaxID=2898435 RepID=UPI002150A117|nr:helix-turn-helix domain-containing protein [Phenylobacterium sp. J367]MCR5878740.1 helix-turn-helix domain-containing protein [Phenylobacterium sp. J367]